MNKLKLEANGQEEKEGRDGRNRGECLALGKMILCFIVSSIRETKSQHQRPAGYG